MIQNAELAPKIWELDRSHFSDGNALVRAQKIRYTCVYLIAQPFLNSNDQVGRRWLEVKNPNGLDRKSASSEFGNTDCGAFLVATRSKLMQRCIDLMLL